MYVSTGRNMHEYIWVQIPVFMHMLICIHVWCAHLCVFVFVCVRKKRERDDDVYGFSFYVYVFVDLSTLAAHAQLRQEKDKQPKVDWDTHLYSMLLSKNYT